MTSDERKNMIYSIVQNKGETLVTALANEFSVSQMTIRRDIDALEKLNLVQRSYGKVFLKSKQPDEGSFELRVSKEPDAKSKIAQIALRYIRGVKSLYADGSSTSYMILKALPQNMELTVLQTAFPV